jgi:peptidyl-prolyl cis-trans isomerase B (cyclophilin B)
MRRPVVAIALMATLSLPAACGTTKTGAPVSSQPTTTGVESTTTTPSGSGGPVETPASIPTDLASIPKRVTPLPPAVNCEYPATAEPAAKPAQPPAAQNVSAQGTVQAVVATRRTGEWKVSLDRTLAPCTVNNFVSLARQNYYNDTTCHRLTTSPSLQVLQCGDPSGRGSGGPGYSFKDEIDLPEIKYGRGMLAMANSGEDTNGSQFFIIYGAAQLPPKYTVFGMLDGPSMSHIDQIAKAGTSSSGGGYPGDGSPVTPVEIAMVAIIE